MAGKKVKESPCCVLTMPLYPEPYQLHVMEKRFIIFERLKRALVQMEMRKLKNLERTKAYRDLQQEIQKELENQKQITAKSKKVGAEATKRLKMLNAQRAEMFKTAGLDKYQFQKDIKPMRAHFDIHVYSSMAIAMADDVWKSFEKYLYGSGRRVHGIRPDSLNSVSGKGQWKEDAQQQELRGLVYRDGKLIWQGGGKKYRPRKEQEKKKRKDTREKKHTLEIRVGVPQTEYEREMLKKRICFCRIVRKWMKTRYKYYVQFVLDGNAYEKERTVVPGRVGIDIGTQSAAIVSDNGVMLVELAEKVNANEEKLHECQRRMDASRRSMNPENFRSDGTVKTKRYRWKNSKHYMKLLGQARELQRKNADIRRYSHYCLANEVLRMGSEVYVENMDFRALQRRKKKTEKNEKGQFKKKKRFGKSLANKAPAMFLMILNNKLRNRCGTQLYKVDKWKFRASQYDHLSQRFTKKALGERRHVLANGDRLQRDLYSAFLIMNADETLKNIDQQRCDAHYEWFKELHDREIVRIQHDGKRHLSSFGV